MCILCTPRLTYRSTYRLTLLSVDISAECWSICRSTYRSSVGRYVDWDVSLGIGDCRHHLTSRLVTSAAQISLIYSRLLRGFFVYNPPCLSSVLYQHLVILHCPYPLSCQLYFVYLGVFHSSVLLDNDWICRAWRPNMKPSEIFEVDQKRMKCI